MIVRGVGPKAAKIAIVGEAPGEYEDKAGIPFVGPAGQELDRLLKAAGIDRGACYLTNVIKQRPPKNDFSIYYEDSHKLIPKPVLKEEHGKLIRELIEVKPNVIIACGNEPLFALTGYKDITKRRGSLYESEVGKVLATIHPSMLLRTKWSSKLPVYRPLVVADFKKAKEESLFPGVRFPKRDILLEPSFDQVVSTLKDMAQSRYVAFDIETRPCPLNNQTLIRCIALADSPSRAICIPFEGRGENFWHREREMDILYMLSGLFSNPRVKSIAHNAKFDMWHLRTMGIFVDNLWMDTMLAWHTYAPELPKSLATLASVFTSQPYWKELGHAPGVENLWKYNCLDALVTYECAMTLERELLEIGLDRFYHNIVVHPLVMPILEMEWRGVKVDLVTRLAAQTEHRETLKQAQANLEEAIGHPLNVLSPKQMKEFLYDELKLPPQTNRKTDKVTADETALTNLMRKFPEKREAFQYILAIRAEAKLLSTYLEAPIDEDGRMRTSYNIGGTKTGRLSSSQSLSGSGTNLQNFPKGIARRMFVPDPGKRFIAADLKQAEARVVAAIAGEQQLLKLFDEDTDVYNVIAAMLFDCFATEVTKDQRQMGKRVVHASNYGMGWNKLRELSGFELSAAEAKTLISKYFSMFPLIKAYHLNVEHQIRTTRRLETPLGRQREFFGEFSSNMIRDALSYVPQSTVADALNIGLIRLWDKLPKGADIMFQLHDSVTVQCLPEQVESLKVLLHECLVFPIIIEATNLSIRIPIDIKVGDNWNEVG